MKQFLTKLYYRLPWTTEPEAEILEVNQWLQLKRINLILAYKYPQGGEISVRVGGTSLNFNELDDRQTAFEAPEGWETRVIETTFDNLDPEARLSLNVTPPGKDFALSILELPVGDLKATSMHLPIFSNVDGRFRNEGLATEVVYGWCFALNPLKVRKIQARLDENPLEVEFPVKRKDIAQTYPDQKDARKCGFECDLPPDKTGGTLTLECKLESDAWIEFGSVDLSSVPKRELEALGDTPVPAVRPSIRAIHHLDNLYIEQQKKVKTKLLGWIFLKDGPPITGVRVQHQNKTLKLRYGLQRGDVHQAYPGQVNALNSGFELQMADLPGNPTLTFQFRTGPGGWITFHQCKPSQITPVFYSAKNISEKKSGVASNVENAQIGRRYGHQFMIAGWCFRLDGKPLDRIRIRTGKLTFEGKCGLKRKDVFEEKKGRYPGSLNSGFEIPLDDIPRNAKLRFEYKTARGRWTVFAVEDFSRFPVSHFATQSEEKRNYNAWLKKHRDLLNISPDTAAGLLPRLEDQPLISILMPVYNTPDIYLREAIQSVLDQQYPHWELCIADDASTEPSVWPALEEFSAKEDRIKIIRREINGHICRASNSALALATGSWCAFLDHDDRLPPDALARAVQFINRHPGAGLFYSDEDKLDAEGKRFDPYFKPDWNPELLEGQNFLCHLTVTRMSLVRQAGGFEPGLEGSQDWDLFLKITEMLEADQVIHIPYTLYHWRAIEGSTALSLEEKGYIRESSLKALQGHCARSRENVEILPIAHGHWRLKYKVPKPVPSVTLIIPTRDQAKILRTCIDSIQNNTTYTNFKFLIVNNQSQKEETRALFAELKDRGIEVVDHDRPFNFSSLNNFAASRAESEYLAFLNNDITVINGDWLEEMISHARKPHVGAVGAKLYYPEDCIQHAGVILGINGIAGHCFKYAVRGEPGQRNRLNLVQQFSAVTAACLVVGKSIFEEVGGFEEEHLGVAFNDIDLCLRIREAGYKNIWTPYAQLYHHESLSRGDDNHLDRKQRVDSEIEYMLRRWGDQLKFDPTYNPNLTLEYEDFSLAWPPRLPSP